PLLLRLRGHDDLADDDKRRGGHRHRDHGTEHTAERAAGDRGDDDEGTGHIDRGCDDAGAAQGRLRPPVHETVRAGGHAQSRGAPTNGPTSGMSEARNATNANSAGSGAPMMVRKIAEHTPLTMPRDSCPRT